MTSTLRSDTFVKLLAFLVLALLLHVRFATRIEAAAAVPPAKWWIQWTDDANNPIPEASFGLSASSPCLLYSANWPEGARLRLWYSSIPGKSLAYSVSDNGTNWSPGVLVRGLNATGSSPQNHPNVVYNPEWPKPFRIYYSSQSGLGWQIRVAESTTGLQFETDQVAFESNRLGDPPQGHAVAWFPGRVASAGDPTLPGPYLLYFRDRSGKGIGYATSTSGYTFVDGADPTKPRSGLLRFPGLPDDLIFTGHPSHVLRLAQNDYRMFLGDDTSYFSYVVSGNGIDWEVAETPVEGVGFTGDRGQWNESKNFEGSMAYLGAGKFILARTGTSQRQDANPALGLAFGVNEFYQLNEQGRWSFFSPMDKYSSEEWSSFSTTGNFPAGGTTGLTQNSDGSVAVLDRKSKGDFYLVHEVALTVPFTVEFRARLDDATGTGIDTLFPKFTLSTILNDPLEPGGQSWETAFSLTRAGGWDLSKDPSLEIDNSDFQSYTLVCRFDETARQSLIRNPDDTAANSKLCRYEIYLNRDFSAPRLAFHGTGAMGWEDTDLDGRIGIGFPEASAGLVTVDWVRWGNGVIFDPIEPPGIVSSGNKPKLSIALGANGSVVIQWTGNGGTLESKTRLLDPWSSLGATNPATLPATSSSQFFRVTR